MKIVLTEKDIKEILEDHIKNTFGIDAKCRIERIYSDIEFEEVEESDDKEEHS